MPPDVTGNLSAARGGTYMDRVLEVELFSQGRQIGCVGVHVVAIPGLGGTTMPAPVMGNHPIAVLAEEQHLCVPVVGGQRPAVAEDNRLPCSPILVENLRSV